MVVAVRYPPTGDFKEQWEAVRKHCRRLLPHLMDSGGFFIAVFEKTGELSCGAQDFLEASRTYLRPIVSYV